MIAVKYGIVRGVTVFELSYGRLRRVAAGSDPIGAFFLKFDPYFNCISEGFAHVLHSLLSKILCQRPMYADARVRPLSNRQ